MMEIIALKLKTMVFSKMKKMKVNIKNKRLKRKKSKKVDFMNAGLKD